MIKILTVIVFALCASSVWAAPQTFIIVQSTATYGDYSSLETAINAKEGDLTGNAGGSITFRIDGTWTSSDTSRATLHNYITGVSSGILIYTTPTARHSGKVTAGCYKLQPGDGFGNYAFYAENTSYVTIDGLVFGSMGSGNIYTVILNGVCNIFSNNIITHHAGNYNAAMFNGGNTSELAANVYNNIIYSKKSNSIGTGKYSTQYINIYNNTIYVSTNSYGIAVGDNACFGTIKNNLVITLSTITACYTDFRNMAHTYNGSSDTSGDIDNLDGTTMFVSTTAGSEDFHLVAGAGAIDIGADLSSIFTTDIDGVTRTGTWDLGADAYGEPAESIVFKRHLRFGGR